jgi:hypothetical protein
MGNHYAMHWQRVREKREQSISDGFITIQRVWTRRGSRLHVSCPKDEQFITGANELGGRYHPKASMWSFSGKSLRLIRELCARVFPASKIQEIGFK